MRLSSDENENEHDTNTVHMQLPFVALSHQCALAAAVALNMAAGFSTGGGFSTSAEAVALCASACLAAGIHG